MNYVAPTRLGETDERNSKAARVREQKQKFDLNINPAFYFFWDFKWRILDLNAAAVKKTFARIFYVRFSDGKSHIKL